MTPNQVQHLLDSGIEAGDVARLLVATGAWTETGAAEIVATLTGSEPARSSLGREPGLAGADRRSTASLRTLSEAP